MTRFPNHEFTGAPLNNRQATAAEMQLLPLFRAILDPMRAELNFPITITSWVRTTGTHTSGQALDIQPCRDSANTEKLFQQRLEDMFQWLDARRNDRLYGTIIHERNHVHVTLPGFQSRYGVAYREPVEGVYVAVKRYGAAVIVLAFVAWYLLQGKA